MTAALALQEALIAALRTDAGVTALVGAGIHDGAPKNAGFPHVALGEVVSRDWDTASDEGAEHFVTLMVWSRASGRREVLVIIGAMMAVLDEADLNLNGHRLVNLSVVASDTRREADGRTWRGRLRLRAVTERA